MRLSVLIGPPGRGTGYEKTRNGSPETFRIEVMGDFRRIRIGNADRLLDVGAHRYVITYRMSRMGRYFATHDELYWNTTGHYWNFPIRHAIATTRLPEGAVLGELAAYVGPAGSTHVIRLPGDAMGATKGDATDTIDKATGPDL